jgi:hypothetical protein
LGVREFLAIVIVYFLPDVPKFIFQRILEAVGVKVDSLVVYAQIPQFEQIFNLLNLLSYVPSVLFDRFL